MKLGNPPPQKLKIQSPPPKTDPPILEPQVSTLGAPLFVQNKNRLRRWQKRASKSRHETCMGAMPTRTNLAGCSPVFSTGMTV